MSLTPKILSFAVMMAIGGTAVAANTDSPAVGRALGLIKTHGAATRVSANDAFIARDVIVDADGTEHVRFDRTYAGLSVLGGDLVVHSRGGQFKSASLTQGAPLNVNTRATLNQSDATVAAGVEFGSNFVGNPSASLMVFARNQGAAKLAYQVNFQGADKNGNDVDMTYIVDAKNGKVLDRWSNNETASAAATFKTLYSGNVTNTTNSITGGFEMRDPSRGNGYTVSAVKGPTSGKIYTDSDNIWGNNTISDGATAAADAQFGVGVTWDYFKLVHGRNGIANNGAGAYNKVHSGRNYVNAYWSDACFCMTYGDGDGVNYGPLVTLDIAGHEMTHGVTSRTANLVYSGESGGLNEATSDIFGTMVEFYANNANDPADYLVGEKMYIKFPAGNKALRYMYNPSLEGAGRSVNCWYSGIASIDVHYSSGPANRFFYLLAEGSGAKTFNGVNHTAPTCNGGTVTGIGRDAAGSIWYKALTTYMTSSTNYAGAKTATLNAAVALGWGVGSVNYNAVLAAWSAVSVN